jgi:cold shock CspA family protein
MNVVVLVGKVADRPFRPSGRERVVVKVDAAGDRRPDKPDRIEVHCFGEVANYAEAKVSLGDIITVHGRLEQRVGKDDMGEFEELRVVADHITVVTGGGGRQSRKSDAPSTPRTEELCDGSECAELQTTHGVVKLFRTREQFGFIETPNGDQDVFFHIRDVHDAVAPSIGDSVQFQQIDGDRGPAARHVTVEE